MGGGAKLSKPPPVDEVFVPVANCVAATVVGDVDVDCVDNGTPVAARNCAELNCPLVLAPLRADRVE